MKLNQTAQVGFMEVPKHEKVRWVNRFFNLVAKRYDLMNSMLSLGIHLVWKRRAIRLLGLTSNSKMLDICGGTGDLSIFAQQRIGSSGLVILYDINRDMIEAGRHTLAHADTRGRISYVQGDAQQIAFPDNVFDAVIVGFGIRNLTDMEKGFSEIYRILKPGGKMLCLEFSQPTHPMFRFLYDKYSFHIMPTLGAMITGSREAYRYLIESIRLFPNPDQLGTTLGNQGFKNVTYSRLTNGIAAIHVGIK